MFSSDTEVMQQRYNGTIKWDGIDNTTCYTGIMTKQCQMCNKTKPVSEFYKSQQTKDGYYSYCRPCKVECNRKSNDKMLSFNRKKHLRQRKNNHLKTAYGITIDQYDAMSKDQNNVCAICLLPEVGRKLAVDHCHKTQKIRGLLCSKCNRAIGQLNDDIPRIKRAVEYLLK